MKARDRHVRGTASCFPGASLKSQVALGASVGFACGGTFAILLGASGPTVAFGGVLGIATGFVAGTLLWIGSADLPEEPIPPVRARSEAHRRSARDAALRAART